VSDFIHRITAVLTGFHVDPSQSVCGCYELTPEDAAGVAERVAAELPRFGEIREAYEFYQLDSDKAMAAQIFAQQVGEILEAES
jgi:hypothetical protein